MKSNDEAINQKYTSFYEARNPAKVYPTEFVVRTFLAKYPRLNMNLKGGARVLDIGFGDGRNTCFLIEQGYETYGIEITEGIVDLLYNRLKHAGMPATLKVGRNSQIPFDNAFFDIILACHASYYVDEDESFDDNLAEIARVMRRDAYFITSLPDQNSYIFNGAIPLDNGHVKIQKDPYQNREGHKMRIFEDFADIENALSPHFKNFSFGSARNNYYGIDERVFWVVCQKK